MAAPLHLTPSITGDGNTLVLVAAIDTASQHLTNIFDNGGNSWNRIVDGTDAGLTGRIEIWSVPNPRPTTDIELHFPVGLERALAVELTEWSGLAAASPVVGFNVEPAGMSNALTTGVASIAAPALVIGAVVFQGVPITATIETTDYTPLVAFTHTNVSGAAAYRVVNGGEAEMRWSLAASRYFTGALVGLRLE